MKRHFENLTRQAGRAVKHWWLMMLAGLLCIAGGILVFVFPLRSYVALSIIFGVLMLVVGATELIAASSSRNYFATRSYMIVGGVLDIVLGIFLCIYPGVTFALLPIMLGMWMLYHSIIIVCFGADLDTFKVPGGGWTIIGGVLLAVLSILVLANPFGVGVAAVVVLAGSALIVFGALLCGIGVKFRDIHKFFDTEE